MYFLFRKKEEDHPACMVQHSQQFFCRIQHQRHHQEITEEVLLLALVLVTRQGLAQAKLYSIPLESNP